MAVVRCLVPDGAGAAEDGGHLCRRHQLSWNRGRGENALPTAGQPRLYPGYDADHLLVGVPGGLAEGEDTVLQQHQPSDFGVALEHLCRRFGEIEPGHDVGHDADGVVEQVAAQGLAVRLIGEAEHRGRVGVVDELMRQERVQQRFDRRIRRAAVEQVLALEGDHVLVCHRV